jgi:hypothetical protein
VQSSSPPQQDLRSTLATLSNTTKSGLKWASKVTLRPVYGIRQALVDYQNGRIMRQRESQAELSSRTSNQHDNAQRRADTQAQISQAQGGPDERCKDRNLPRDKGDNYPRRINRGWKHQGGEFPWRIERTVQEEENWRGVWVLEVKDMFLLEWENEYELLGRRWRQNTVPQAHWPFPYKREPDRLRDWLQRP